VGHRDHSTHVSLAGQQRQPVEHEAAGVGIVAFRALAEGEWEAARRRVPLGADREAVEAAVGKAADGVIGKVGPNGEDTRCVCFWQRCYDEPVVQLLVEFDEDGRAVSAEVVYWPGPTPWERFRARLGW
jgi:hypothetical protein